MRADPQSADLMDIGGCPAMSRTADRGILRPGLLAWAAFAQSKLGWAVQVAVVERPRGMETMPVAAILGMAVRLWFWD